MNEIIQAIAVYALPVIFAITLHEAAHAYAAKYFGDNTAYALGRMSMNPLRHIDPIGTILLPALVFMTSSKMGYPMLFGYAKPVPVDYGRLRNPKKQMAFVALAGPLMNLAMAFGWVVFALLLAATHVSESYPYAVARAGLMVNAMICAFNLIPLPPLDGSRVVASILPNRLAAQYYKIEPYGIFILLGLLVTHVLDPMILSMAEWTRDLAFLMATPLIYLLS